MNDYITIVCPICHESVDIPRELDKDGKKDIMIEYGWHKYEGHYVCEMCYEEQNT